MIPTMTSLAKELGQPAIYLVLSLAILAWIAKSYVGLRKDMARAYRENVIETLKIVRQLQSGAKKNPELEPIKIELLRRLGVVDKQLEAADQKIASDTSARNSLFAPEPMLTLGAAAALVMMISNSIGSAFEVSRATVAVFLSLLFAVLVIAPSQRTWTVLILSYPLVTSALFIMALGFNALGVSFAR